MKLSFSISKNKRNTIRSFVLAALMITAGGIQAQEDSTETGREPVTRTFRGPQLINMPTNEIVDGLTFGIQHRFGQIIDKDVLYDFLGMDLSANIRFSLGYPIIKDRMMVEIGRTKFGKNLDLELKYQVLRQTTKNEIPVSVAVYANPCLSMERFAQVPNYAFFADSTTAFKNKDAHRLSYNYQILVTRKFSKKFSMEISPTFIYKNLVAVAANPKDQKDNHTIAIQAGARFKFSSKGSVMAEYGHAFNNRDSLTVDPMSVGVEFSTVGHVFQIVMSSSNNILGPGIFTVNNTAIKNGIFIGFNMKRFF